MAEAFLRRALAERNIAATVSSSGLMASGRPAPDDVISVMTSHGMDLRPHVSRQIDEQIIHDADLILGMERRHLTEIVGINADSYARVFTLPEFIHRVEMLEHDPRDLHEALAMIAQTRTRRDVLRVTIDQEVPDPMGKSTKTFERVAQEIQGMVNEMVQHLWPLAEPVSTGNV